MADPHAMTPEQVAAILPYLEGSPGDSWHPEEDLPTELPPDPRTDHEYARWGRWVENLCLSFGATFETAARVAAEFVQGVRRERRSPTEGGEDG